MDAVFSVPEPRNEPVRTYEPGSADRERLQRRLDRAGRRADRPADDHRAASSGWPAASRSTWSSRTSTRTCWGSPATPPTTTPAPRCTAAKDAAPMWRALPFEERAAIFLRAAELLAGPWRDTLNAATMLGQSKTAVQAEIDAACELIDFLRFNVHFARELLAEQPNSSPGVWNRFDHRPLEGFVYAITPFNFTAIAGNLPTAPALMGNTVVWKPGPTQQFAAHFTMRLFEAAGLPPGVINMVTGRGEAVSEVVLADPDLAGIHFTGSTKVFQHLWQTVGENIARYRGYPRLVGETGGKDFVVAHPSADVDALHTALVRGAYEYQGQKCSAASRAYVPRSLWEGGLRDRLAATADSLTYGDVTDFAQLRRRGDRRPGVRQAHRRAGPDRRRRRAAGPGRRHRRRLGRLVRPADVVECADPAHEVFTTEYFGPILGVHVYDDAGFDDVVAQAESIAPYALTGSIFATDRRVVDAVARGAALRRGQLLHQRQADRRGRRAAAVRRRPGQRHQRQGGLLAQPGPLDVAADDQGDLRPADRLPYPHMG